jgi:hypothetical protein
MLALDVDKYRNAVGVHELLHSEADALPMYAMRNVRNKEETRQKYEGEKRRVEEAFKALPEIPSPALKEETTVDPAFLQYDVDEGQSSCVVVCHDLHHMMMVVEDKHMDARNLGVTMGCADLKGIFEKKDQLPLLGVASVLRYAAEDAKRRLVGPNVELPLGLQDETNKNKVHEDVLLNVYSLVHPTCDADAREIVYRVQPRERVVQMHLVRRPSINPRDVSGGMKKRAEDAMRAAMVVGLAELQAKQNVVFSQPERSSTTLNSKDEAVCCATDHPRLVYVSVDPAAPSTGSGGGASHDVGGLFMACALYRSILGVRSVAKDENQFSLNAVRALSSDLSVVAMWRFAFADKVPYLQDDAKPKVRATSRFFDAIEQFYRVGDDLKSVFLQPSVRFAIHAGQYDKLKAEALNGYRILSLEEETRNVWKYWKKKVTSEEWYFRRLLLGNADTHTPLLAISDAYFRSEYSWRDERFGEFRDVPREDRVRLMAKWLQTVVTKEYAFHSEKTADVPDDVTRTPSYQLARYANDCYRRYFKARGKSMPEPGHFDADGILDVIVCSFVFRCMVMVREGGEVDGAIVFHTDWPDPEAMREHRVLVIQRQEIDLVGVTLNNVLPKNIVTKLQYFGCVPKHPALSLTYLYFQHYASDIRKQPSLVAAPVGRDRQRNEEWHPIAWEHAELYLPLHFTKRLLHPSPLEEDKGRRLERVTIPPIVTGAEEDTRVWTPAPSAVSKFETWRDVCLLRSSLCELLPSLPPNAIVVDTTGIRSGTPRTDDDSAVVVYAFEHVGKREYLHIL